MGDLAVCRVCEEPFDPDLVHATFRAAFATRVGWPYEGRRPNWTRRFCSERCRNIDIKVRAKIQNDNTARRRAATKTTGTEP